jgi:hypothetical protein
MSNRLLKIFLWVGRLAFLSVIALVAFQAGWGYAVLTAVLLLLVCFGCYAEQDLGKYSGYV